MIIINTTAGIYGSRHRKLLFKAKVQYYIYSLKKAAPTKKKRDIIMVCSYNVRKH